MTEAVALPKKNKLAPVSKAPTERNDVLEPFNLLIFGKPGTGKTTCADQAPSPVIVRDSQERTIDRLKRAGQLNSEVVTLPVCPKRGDDSPADDSHPWIVLNNIIESLPESHPNCRTLILDSLTGLEKLCFDYVSRRDYDGNWFRFMDYSKGPKTAAKHDWPLLFDSIGEIQDQGWNVICIAHENTKNDTDPQFGSYDKFVPYLDKDVWQNTHRWAEMVIRMSLRKQEVQKRGELKRRMSSSGERVIYTQPHALWDAKSPSQMDDEILMGDSPQEAWEAFWNAYKHAMGV